MLLVLRGAYMLPCVLSTTEKQEAQELLDEIQQQPGVFVLRGPAVVITNVVTASEFLAGTMKQNSHSPTHCKYENNLQESMRTLTIHQTAHWYATKHSCCACEAQKRRAGPIVSRTPNSFVFNDVVGLDKAHFTCKKHRLLVYWIAACSFPSRPVGRNYEDRAQEQLVAIIRKAPHPCHRSATQLVLWHGCRKSFKRRDTT